MFPLSLSGPTFSWFTSLPSNSIKGWEDLETKFHTCFDSGVMEKGITDLVDVRQGNNESRSHYIQRFREVRNQCYSLTLLDLEIISTAIQGLIPVIREKISFDCPNLAALAKKIANIVAQFRYTRYNKPQKVGSAECGSFFMEEIVDDPDSDNEEVATMD